MAEILDYFDAINIDVAKRKYYNVNKVNAVLDDLRGLAEKLVEENARQRKEITRLNDELGRRKEGEDQARGLLADLQAAYRDTMTKAHDRADGIVREAEAHSEAVRQRAAQELEQQRGLAVEELKDCFNRLQSREEENIRFLNQHLEQFLSTIQGRQTAPPAAAETGSYLSGAALAPGAHLSAPETDNEPDGADLYQLRALELQIQRLSDEINALETGR